MLVTGGSDDLTGPLIAAELYDPSMRSFAGVGNMAVARDRHTATLLNDGVLPAQVDIAASAASNGRNPRRWNPHCRNPG